MSKLDEHLDYMGSSYYPGHEYPESYEPQNVKLRDEAREAIYQDLLELVGDDQTKTSVLEKVNERRGWHNQLRAELRNKLKDYCGIVG